MSGLFTPQSIAALVLTLIFAVVALRRPVRGIQMYAILGSAPFLQLGAFSGRTISQGFMMAEALATVLFGVWVARRSSHHRLFVMPFDTPLVLFAIITVVSQLAVMMLPDHRVQLSSIAVATGQLLLVFWPIAVYLAAAEFITSTDHLRWLQRAILVLACTQFVMPFLPNSWNKYLGWVWTFGTFAAPFALAAAFATRSTLARLYYLAIAVLPFVRGVQEGKAFLYIYIAAALGTILWLRAARLVAIGASLVAALALMGLVVVGERILTDPVDALLAKEQKQMSYGGRSGRGALAADAVSIWQEAPILGVGPANSYIYMLQRSPIGTPHSQYLNILVEFGLLGTVLWLGFLATVLHTGLRIYREAVNPAHRTFLLGWLGMFAGMSAGCLTGDFMIHSIRNGGIELFSGYYLQWVMLGGVVAVDRLERAARQHPVAPASRSTTRVTRTTPRLVPLTGPAGASRVVRS